MDITPGSHVNVVVKSELRTDRARKTLARLFLKDQRLRKSRQQDPKHFDEHIRAGRVWRHTKRGSDAIPPRIGDHARILATLDVIRDLHSVEKYIEVN